MKSFAVYRFMVKPKGMNIFLNLEFESARMKELSGKVGLTYSHLTIMLQAMQREGLIVKIKDSNGFKVELTEKGKKLCELFKQIKNVVETEEKEDE